MFSSLFHVRKVNFRNVVAVISASIVLSMISYAVIPDRTWYLRATRYAYNGVRDFRCAYEGARDTDQEIPNKILDSHDKNEVHHLGEDVEAERLKKEIKILCWVMTQPSSHLKKAAHIKATWGKRCNKLIFMSSQNDTDLGAIDLQVGDGRQLLWGKTRAAFQYVYQHHLNDYDWFFKGDDDTYVIMENMRYTLSPYDPSYPIYFGSRFRHFSPQGYMSGGGGYVLSREAVKQFAEKALPNDTLCRKDPGGAEDAEMGKCLHNIGVLAGDSRDNFGRGRFFPFDPITHLHGGVPAWYLDYVYYKPDTGLNCCSDTAVTFHYVSPERLYELEYLLYHVRPYGIVHHDPYPAPLPQDKDSIPPPILEKAKLLNPQKKLEVGHSEQENQASSKGTTINN